MHAEVYGAYGRAMAQAVTRRPPTAEARVRSRVSPCGICGGQSGTGTGFSPSTSIFPCKFHSTGAPLLGKGHPGPGIITYNILSVEVSLCFCGALLHVRVERNISVF
jgi:hypothetical protein